jgi:hypothetical protein
MTYRVFFRDFSAGMDSNSFAFGWEEQRSDRSRDAGVLIDPGRKNSRSNPI